MKNVKAIPTIIIDVEHNLNQWLANLTANRLMRKWFKDLLQKHFSKN